MKTKVENQKNPSQKENNKRNLEEGTCETEGHNTGYSGVGLLSWLKYLQVSCVVMSQSYTSLSLFPI